MTVIDFGPIRTIKDDLIISPSTPRLAVRFAPKLIYLGDLQYIRGETFHVEEFILINTNGLGHLTQLLLVHFAGYLENNEGAYDLPQGSLITLAGDPYLMEQFTIPLPEGGARMAESEVSHAIDYVRQRSYTLPGDMACQRFRRVVSNDLRCEFTILYAEPDDPTMLTGESAEQDEPEQVPAPPVTPQALLEHALETFEILKE